MGASQYTAFGVCWIGFWSSDSPNENSLLEKIYSRTRIYEIPSKNGNLENQESSCHLEFYPWVYQPWPGDVGAFEISDPRIHPFSEEKR